MLRHVSVIALIAGLAACDGVNTGSDENLPPFVEAGVDGTANEGELVQLNGSVIDTEGGVTFAWTQVSGIMVVFNDATTQDPIFRAPRVNSDETLVFELTATDGTNPAVSDTVTYVISDAVRNQPSPQGIDDDTQQRRTDARGKRNGNRPMQDSKEVRTFDGTNNNIANSTWGASFEHLQRLGSADYADGISSLAGENRPSAREISNEIVNQDDGTSTPNTFNGSDFVWQWGQFIDHDMDLTDGAEESADIEVPTGDTSFDPNSTGAAVILFNRALFDPNTGTDAANPREQENEITSWIDGSMVYGSDEDRATALRDTTTPYLLATSTGNLLPFNTAGLTNANAFGVADEELFVAGDVRVNEQLGLATMHTLFVREHNRIAGILKSQNPNGTDDEIFEATRRLVIAKIQIITYDEWLPSLIGAGAIPAYTGYDNTINPTIFNEFSVAAFRLGHSMLNEQLLRLDAAGATIADGDIDLADAFFTAPATLQAETDIDPILRGLATQQHQKLDEKIVSDVRNFLFGQPGAGGLDLASLNIQRGRDHGVGSYNDTRAAMGLARVTGFSEITSDSTLADALFDTYGSVDDIDLWVGGLAEDPVAGSQLGELFQAIMVRQFTDLRDGDRFWYENDLSSNEMNFVAGTTLAKVIQDNTDIGSELQTNVFVAP